MAGMMLERRPAATRGSPRVGFTVDQIVSQYRIVEPIDADQRGIVYVAEHVEQRASAMLRALDTTSAPKTRIHSLFNDARFICALRHPAIAQILDFGYADDGQPFIVTELLHGTTLADRLSRGRELSVVQALTIAKEIAAALTAAHARGVMHRGLEPRSVVLTGDSEQVKVIDFGLARLDLATIATSNQRSDLHSLGCILFEMFEGRPPSVADHERTEVAAPPAVRTLVASLLAGDPLRRSGGIDVRSAGLTALTIDRIIAELDGTHAWLSTEQADSSETLVETTWKIRIGVTRDWIMLLAALLIASVFLVAMFATYWFVAR